MTSTFPIRRIRCRIGRVLVTEDGDGWRTWLVMDQRFVDGRTDVLTYVTRAADEAVARERSAGGESVRVDERERIAIGW